MEVGLVTKIDIDREMQQAYLDYAMSTIVARALPDARDGLKPVHRRILYAMYDMGLRADSAYKKSARIVGEVLGKYHPHGDAAVYESMARMAQDFSLRYMLVDGQGNFGSQDDDPPAAMRYTEARLTAMAENMLVDIGKNTVEFSDNFDGTLREPTVLPSAVPNLLVNGTSGIAVGMATSIPPHNLGEVVDAMQFMLTKWEQLDDIGVEELMAFVKGPDFPTGGVIIHEESGDGLMAVYSTGRGRVSVQARAHLEEMERGRNRIIVTELPYMVYKAPLIARIAELVREEKLEGIVDLRDESDRQGMRIVIELSKTAEPEDVLRQLYKHTPMQSTFGINILALVGGEPRLLGLKQALRVYLEHRLEIVRRRSEYDLERARARAHILEGLRIALKHLDEIIDLIRKAPDAETAHARLMKKYRLSEIQAQAILDMPLKRLAALERKKIEEEYKEVTALIKSLEALLKSPKKMREVVSQELAAVREAYSDRRRTHIVGLKEGERKATFLTSSDLQPDKMIWVSVTSDGLISRTLDEDAPRLSGKDAPVCLVQASTRDTLYLVCEGGEAAAIPVHALPESESPAEGTPLNKVSPLREENRLAAIFSLPQRNRDGDENILEKWFVLTATHQGMVKRSALSELPGPSANTFTLARVNENDQLGWVKISDGKGEILLLSAQGMAIRFGEDEVRPMGLVAAGVMGLKLGSGDELSGMEILPQPGEVFMVASDGGAKRVKIDQFPKQGRYGQGVLAWKIPGAARIVGMTIGKGTARAILHLHKLAAKMIRLDEAPLQTRAARGASIQEIKAGDRVMRLSIPWEAPRPGDSRTAKDEKEAKKAKDSRPPAGSRTTKAPAALKPEEQKPAAKKSQATKATPVSSQQLEMKLDSAAPEKKRKTARSEAAQPAATNSKAVDKPAAKRPAAKTATAKAAPAASKPPSTTTGKPVSKSPAGATQPEKKAAPPAKKTATVKSSETVKTAVKKTAAVDRPATKSSTPAKKTTAAKSSETAKSPAKKAAPVEKQPLKTPAPAKKASTTEQSAQKPASTTGKATAKTPVKKVAAVQKPVANKAPASKTAATKAGAAAKKPAAAGKGDAAKKPVAKARTSTAKTTARPAAKRKTTKKKPASTDSSKSS